ncbi:factor-independent urate hydroxylase [Paenibacillus xylanilyticus]|uniref:Urate oxidase n=1 Tax=Paenibacillus xylanilyticus TaxID=248903 RepID=A0A7Y6EYS8_9BACL|nr:urate oxidase [Paenibacillus xylanilyticus]NUU78880.1 urate oxidase [Paenibacillus xylanilyticus]
MSDLIKLVNSWSVTQFVHTFGGLFEESPWVAERSWTLRPFDSMEHMINVMKNVVETSEDKVILQLLRNHPDLGARISMSSNSVQEQAGAGLDSLSPEMYSELSQLNKEYTSRFGFPFILAVKGHTAHSILESMRQRNGRGREEEFQTALKEVFKIASIRLEQWLAQIGHEHELVAKTAAMPKRTMYYGKGDVWLYRSYAKPLTGISPIPESPFTGRSNILFGMNIKVAVQGDEFLPSFTEGDNSLIVATDSMKNFILKHAASYTGATVEGFLAYVSQRLLETYSQMTKVQMTADQIPFADVPIGVDGSYRSSALVFRYSQNDRATAAIEAERNGQQIEWSNHFSGVADLRLIKVKGSEFSGFVRDEYTTLPEAMDRPLFIFLDINWRYDDPKDGMDDSRGRYVAAEQVSDVAAAVFHECRSASIQHLLYHIGLRLLKRFGQLSEVSFESNNRTWDTVLEEVKEGDGKVYTEPRPPYGFQGFSMTRNDLESAGDGSKREGGL